MGVDYNNSSPCLFYYTTGVHYFLFHSYLFTSSGFLFYSYNVTSESLRNQFLALFYLLSHTDNIKRHGNSFNMYIEEPFSIITISYLLMLWYTALDKQKCHPAKTLERPNLYFIINFLLVSVWKWTRLFKTLVWYFACWGAYNYDIKTPPPSGTAATSIHLLLNPSSKLSDTLCLDCLIPPWLDSLSLSSVNLSHKTLLS